MSLSVGTNHGEGKKQPEQPGSFSPPALPERTSPHKHGALFHDAKQLASFKVQSVMGSTALYRGIYTFLSYCSVATTVLEDPDRAMSAVSSLGGPYHTVSTSAETLVPDCRREGTPRIAGPHGLIARSTSLPHLR